MEIKLIAGTISSTIFTLSNIPMLVKAAKTRSLNSYSYAYILMSNMANVIHCFYVYSLPFGPIWFLHGFYTISALLMLFWYLRYEKHAKFREIVSEANEFSTITNFRDLGQQSASCSKSLFSLSVNELVRLWHDGCIRDRLNHNREHSLKSII